MYHIKHDKRTRTTVGLISDALTTLILEGRWEGLTVTALADRAQVGRATFYRSFDFIEDVLRYQVDCAMDELFRYVYAQINELPFFYEIDLYRHFFRFWDRRDTLLRTLIMSNQRSLFKNQFTALYLNKLAFVQKNLGIQDSHWSYFVILRSAAFADGLFEWIQQGKKENAEEISKILLISFSELHAVKLTIDRENVAKDYNFEIFEEEEFS